MGSFLKRAIEFKKNRSLNGVSEDDTQGIPEEDRKEILSEIDKIAASNRISVTPELFVIKAKKRGTALPLLVNLFAVIVLCATLFLMYTLFREEEKTLSIGQDLSGSVEGKLLEELKRDSEERLSEKDREILGIQNRLQEINQERTALRETMDERIRLREEELRAGIAEELENLRSRLISQGASESVIAAEITRLEAERGQEINRRIAQIREEAEQERALLEADLKRIEEETNTNLARANREKNELINTMAEREETLRSQYESKIAGTEKSLTQAREEISRLTEQKNREAYLTGQFTGLYASLRDNIRKGNLSEAERNMAQLKQLLNDDLYLSVPSLRERRNAEMFILDSIENLLLKEKERRISENGPTPSTGLTLLEVQELVRQGDLMAEQGDSAGAAKQYILALEQVPELRRSHQFLLEKSLSAETGSGETTPKPSAEAQKLLQEAEAYVLSGRYEEASASYLALLLKHPDSTEASRVPDSFTKLIRSQNEELARIRVQNTQLAGISQERLSAIRNLENQLAVKIAEYQTAAEQRSEGSSPNTDRELLQELERLKEIEALKANLQIRYEEFTASIDQVNLAQGNDFTLIKAKQSFDLFLSSPEAETLLPGLFDRVRAYDQAFEKTGRRTALLDTVEFVSELAELSSPEERKAHIAREKETINEPEMIVFLNELTQLLGR